jgi:hypothetical protein
MVGTQDVEQYIEWEKSQNSMLTNFVKQVSPAHIIGLFALVIMGIYLITTKVANQKWILGAIALVVVVMLFRREKAKEKKPIPENVIKIITQRLMDRKIGIEYQNGTKIELNGYCKLRYQGEWGGFYMPWKWEVGVTITETNGLRRTVLVILEPYEGFITGIVEKPAGYKGDESTDIKVIIPTQVKVEETKEK